jgi:hypothetical protein
MGRRQEAEGAFVKAIAHSAKRTARRALLIADHRSRNRNESKKPRTNGKLLVKAAFYLSDFDEGSK